MRSTYAAAQAAVECFNGRFAGQRVKVEDFFAEAALLVCSKDGRRLSGVLDRKGGAKVMVFELCERRGAAPFRMLAVWAEDEGHLYEQERVPDDFRDLLAYRPEQHSAFPEGMARMGAAEDVPAAVMPLPVLAEQAAEVEKPLPEGPVPAAQVDAPENLWPLLGRMLPHEGITREKYAVEMMFSAELFASERGRRRRAFFSGGEALAQMRAGTLPADTLNILILQLTALLQALCTVTDFDSALEKPGGVWRRKAAV